MQPLRKGWEKRTNINSPQMARLFEVEKGLYKVHKGEELAPPNVKQVWNPGRFMIPESPTDKQVRLDAAVKAGLMDRVWAVMEMYDLPTVAAAREFLEEMEARNKDFKPETPEPPAGGFGGLPPGLQPRGRIT
jgi:hypothetical protein